MERPGGGGHSRGDAGMNAWLDLTLSTAEETELSGPYLRIMTVGLEAG